MQAVVVLPSIPDTDSPDDWAERMWLRVCGDGMLARTTFRERPFSSQLETVTDYAGYLFVVVGVSIGLSRQFGTPVWLEPGRLTAAMAYGIVL